MGVSLCSPGVTTERSPFYFEQFLANVGDGRAGIATQTPENMMVRNACYWSAPTIYPRERPAGLSVKHRRSGSDPLISPMKTDQPNIFGQDVWRGGRGADNMHKLKVDTTWHARSIISLADIQDSEDNMNDELKRNEKVIRESNNILHRSVSELNLTHGITDVNAKMNNFLSKKPPVALHRSHPPNNTPRRFSYPMKLPLDIGRHGLGLKNSGSIKMDSSKIKKHLELQEPIQKNYVKTNKT